MGFSFSKEIHKQNIKPNRYTWKSDIPDKRDKYAKYTDFTVDLEVPSIIDLRENCPPIVDQGNLGSSTANSILFLYRYREMLKKELCTFMPSTLFLYYNSRIKDECIDQDNGSSIRDGLKCLNKLGVCSEKMWEYDISKFTDKPSDECYVFASLHKSIKYFKLNQDLALFKTCLINGFPFIFGLTLYESFDSDKTKTTGLIDLPNINEKVIGAHTMAVIGYDDKKKHFIIRNSWGNKWGDKGYCYLPYDYIMDKDLATDFWILDTLIPV